MSPNRIVAVLTPLVFAPAAGAICAYLAEHFPGVEVDQGSLQQVFVAGAAIALVPAAQWLHGWQKFEARSADAEQAITLANIAAGAPAQAVSEPEVSTNGDGLDPFAGLDDLEGLDGLDGDAFAELDDMATTVEE